jgi:FixJ family two-component response regulator
LGPSKPAARPMQTVYIVDDDPNFARGIARLVEASGWRVEVFASAAQFLARPRESDSAGCILLDVRMPGMRGPELQRAMAAAGIDMPVIFLTGYGDVPTSVAAMKHGAVDFLEKPVRAEVLVAAIRQALARHAEARARASERHALGQRVARLSPREYEVMAQVVAGRLNKQIAADLGISEKTVKAHRGKVMEKMEAPSLAALVDLCRAAGIADQGRPR